MTYKTLCEEAYEANLEIPRRGLAIYTWGNVSAFDSASGVFAIKPSGVAYDALRPTDMVIVDLEGIVVDGKLKPSSDTETHRVLYREFSGVRGITHTHSSYATGWAQTYSPVPLYGTTHADHAAQAVPCTAIMSPEACKNNYELETGKLIVSAFNGINPIETPMVLVAGHGPFAWGESAAKSVYNAAVLEEVCKMAFVTRAINPAAAPLPAHIVKKHWERKHGPNAYYGQ